MDRDLNAGISYESRGSSVFLRVIGAYFFTCLLKSTVREFGRVAGCGKTCGHNMDEGEVRRRMERAMRRIEDFYFGDEEEAGERMFNKFAAKHAQHFAPGVGAEEGENKLEYTVAYQEFAQMFESKLEELISQEGLTVQVFFDQLKRDSAQDEDVAVFVHVILALADYTTFVDMMAAYCQEHQS